MGLVEAARQTGELLGGTRCRYDLNKIASNMSLGMIGGGVGSLLSGYYSSIGMSETAAGIATDFSSGYQDVLTALFD